MTKRNKKPNAAAEHALAWEALLTQELAGRPVNTQLGPAPSPDHYLVQFTFQGLLGLDVNEPKWTIYFVGGHAHGMAHEPFLLSRLRAASGPTTPMPGGFYGTAMNGLHLQPVLNEGVPFNPKRAPLSSLTQPRSQDERDSLNWLINPADFLDAGEPKKEAELKAACMASFSMTGGTLRTLLLEGQNNPNTPTQIPDLYRGWADGKARAVTRTLAAEFYHKGDLVLDGPKKSFTYKNPTKAPVAIEFVNHRCATGSMAHFRALYLFYNNPRIRNLPQRHRRGNAPRIPLQALICQNEACPTALLRYKPDAGGNRLGG